jgi:hypothetical protein
MATFKVEGMDELLKSMKRLEKLPQKVVTKAVQKAIKLPLAQAKKGGWIDQTGSLRRGIIKKAERKRVAGKKVYQVTFDDKMNDVFVKMTKDGKRYYYPASQEYGFRTKNGGYVPGFHFLKEGLESTAPSFEKTVVNEMSKEIDKI